MLAAARGRVKPNCPLARHGTLPVKSDACVPFRVPSARSGSGARVGDLAHRVEHAVAELHLDVVGRDRPEVDADLAPGTPPRP